MPSSILFRANECLAIVLSCALVLQAAPVQAPEGAGGAGKLNLVIVEGDGAINNLKQRVAREPIVQVEDENHKPVAGAAVTFFLPNSGPSGTFANGARTMTALTDQNGRVVARGIKLNRATGQMQIRVSASYQGMSGSAIITQTNQVLAAGAAAGAAAGTAISTKAIVILAIAAAVAAGGAVATTHGGSSPSAPAATPTVITPGTPTVGGPR